MRFFIRGKGCEAFVEADNLQDAFTRFVKEQDGELGLILIGHTEYFPPGNIPETAIGVRTTIPLVKAGLWTKKQAKDFNKVLCGRRIV